MSTFAGSLRNFWQSIFPSTRTPTLAPDANPDLPRSRGEAAPQDLRIQASLYHYAAIVVGVYDGDTITVDIDLGLQIWKTGEKLRLWKINTPEMRGEDKEAGTAARDFMRSMVDGKQILVRTILDKRGVDQTGKYGRLLAEVLAPDGNGGYINANEEMLRRGYAQPMGADGSKTRGMSDSPAPVPAVVDCPYCGQERVVNQATHFVEACPNCLDEPYAL